MLGDLADLRRRARADRHSYPFPLLFFGIASFLAVPLYAPSSPSPHLVVRAVEWNPLAVLGAHSEVRHPLLLGLYWLAVLVVGAPATVWWYRRRGLKVGIETSTKGYLGAVTIGLSAPLVSMAILYVLPMTSFGFPTQPSATGIGVILLALATVLWRLRAPHASTLVAAVLGTAWLQFAHSLIGQFIVIGLGLVVLARLERSNWLDTVTGAYVVTLCLTATFLPPHITPATTLSMATVVLLPGFVLIAGGLVGLRRG